MQLDTNLGARIEITQQTTTPDDMLPSIVEAHIVAIIPAYNEDRFIGSVVLKTLQYAGTVIVVDDGSSDATADIATAAGAQVIRHTTNRGKGNALNTALAAARNMSPDVVVMLDADGQHRPRELARVAAPILSGAADLVIGSRYLENKSDVPRSRVLGHWFFNKLTRLFSGATASDSQSGFRAFSAAALDCIKFKSDGFSVESEMQFIANECGLRLVEVPITIQYTDKPKRNVIQHGLKVLNGMLYLIGQYRPLLYFGLPGLAFFVLGVAWGAWVVDIYRRTSELAVGYAMISILFAILGNMALTTGITLHSIRGLLISLFNQKFDQS